jgi:hypothetical protein
MEKRLKKLREAALRRDTGSQLFRDVVFKSAFVIYFSVHFLSERFKVVIGIALAFRRF